MDRPKLPSVAELRRAAEATDDGAKRIFEQYLDSVKRDEDRLDRELDARLAYQRHVQHYRYLSVVCGTGLAINSLGVCALGVYRKVDLIPLAWVLGPLTGLAGVFVWGYRPRSTRREVEPPEREQRRTNDLPPEPSPD